MTSKLGKVFGGLTVIGVKRIELSTGLVQYPLLCRCECGVEVAASDSKLEDGVVYRCSKHCTVVPKRRRDWPRRTEHPLYLTWLQMIARCHRKYSPEWKYYGARGVTVCDRWREDFWAFVQDMGTRPDGCTIDRRDVNKGYEVDNCRWLPRTEQPKNRRPKEEWGK